MDEIRALLRAPSGNGVLHGQLAAAVRQLEVSAGAACELTIANSLWSQVGAAVLASFVELTTQSYGATVNTVDFRADPDGVRRRINDWIRVRTRGRIPAALNSPHPPDTRLALVNVIYFKGGWEYPFERRRTREAPFHREDGTEVAALLMREIVAAAYVEAPGYQAVLLPYAGRALAMWVLLPDRNDGLQSLEASLTAATLAELTRLARHTEVEVVLPRFKLNCSSDLVQCLQALGIRRAFSPGADFSGINGVGPSDDAALYVASVVHSAFCEVHEAGTEAAAVTASEMGFAGEPVDPALFRADHPFLFAIVDTASGAILFLGRVIDPTSDS